MKIRATWRSAPTRRRWFAAATGGGLCLFATGLSGASEFWNKKDPAAWTSDEILQLTTRSPWARSARVLPKRGRDRGSFQSAVPEVAGGRAGGRGTGPELVVPVSEVTVVWESAQPLRDALKYSFPSDFAKRYVIGVSDLPVANGGRPVSQDSLQASLEARGRSPLDAGAVQPIQRGSVVLFGFSKELLPLTAVDKDVVFTLTAERFSVRAKFDPREMIYRGMLAL